MAKKVKLDLSGDGLKKMAINHCEKAIFAICAVLLLLFVYFGFSREVFDDEKTNPKKLIASAKQSEGKIEATKWDEDPNSDDEPSFKTYRVPNLGIPKKVERLLADKIDASVYPAPAIGNLQESSKPKRLNPDIYAVQDLHAQFAYQYVAGKELGVPINKLAMAPLEVKEERKEKKKSGGSRGGLGGGSGSGAGGMSGNGSMQDGNGGGSGSGAGGMDGNGGSGAGSGDSGKSEYPTKPVPEYLLAEMEGVPGAGAIENVGIIQRQMVSVTGLIPYKKQFEAYEKTFIGSRKYDPEKDYPKYIGLVVYRRVNGGEWKDITDEVKSSNERVSPVAFPNLIEADKYDPFLNAKIPSILMTNFDEFVTHPKLKIRDFLVGMGTVDEESGNDGSSSFNEFNGFNNSTSKKEGEEDEDDKAKVVKYPTSEEAPEFKQIRFFDLLTSNSPPIKLGDKLEYKVNAILSNPNLPMAFVKGERQKAGMGSGMGSGMNSGREGPSSGGGGSGASAGDGESAGGNMTGDGRMTGGSGSGGAGKDGEEDNKNKMAELEAELELEMLGNESITDSDLAGSIRPEILKIKDLGPADIEDKDVAKKYGLVVPESNVSQPVIFTAITDKFVGGSVEPMTIRRAENVEFFDSDPTAKIVVLVQDPKISLSVPGKTDVSSGSPLVFSSQAEIFNPLDSTIRILGDPQKDDEGKPIDGKFSDYSFQSSGFVLDVKPTRVIKASQSKDEYVTPGEILVFDGNGGFSLRNELDDIGDFNRLTYVESDTPKPSAKKSGMSGFGDGGLGGNRGGLGGGGGGTPN